MKSTKTLEFGKVKNKIKSHLDINSNTFKSNSEKFIDLIKEYDSEEKKIKAGGGSVKIQKQHDKGRMTARERIKHLIGDTFFEIGLYAAHDMYKEVGEINSGGVIAIASEINKTENLLEKQLDKIGDRLNLVLSESKKNNESTDIVARRIAFQRIKGS